MVKEYWTTTEVIELFQVEERFLNRLEEEDIVCPECGERPSDKAFSAGELEKLRLAKLLVEEMGVNLPGVEIILHMRQSMFDMRTQFDTILEDVALHLQKALRDRTSS